MWNARLSAWTSFASLVFSLGLLVGLPAQAHAERAESLVDYIRGREDLSPPERKRFEREIRKRFGGAALEKNQRAEELTVARSILAAALFMDTPPDVAVRSAWSGYHGALGYVPPPIAIHYEILALQGKKPRGRPIDLAFNFPQFYSEEIAPALVAYWEAALAAGRIPDSALSETQEALEETRVRMRPLLLDKLRLLARLDRERVAARGAREAELVSDLAAIEGELERSFKHVARRPEVLDRTRRPFDRLRIQLDDLGLKLTNEDRMLDPEAPSPPPRPVDPPPAPPAPPETPATPEPPKVVDPKPARPRSKAREPDLDDPPALPVPLPPQPRPGTTEPMPPIQKEAIEQLLEAYRGRLAATIEPWVGTPYRYGAAQRGIATDCSGFTSGVFDDGFRIQLPRVSGDQYRTGVSVSRNALRPGDLVFFDFTDSGKIGHVGIYVGEGRFAHASSRNGVTFEPLGKKHYAHAFRGARRVLAYPPSF